MALYVYLILTTTWFAQAEYGFATCFLSSPALFGKRKVFINMRLYSLNYSLTQYIVACGTNYQKCIHGAFFHCVAWLSIIIPMVEFFLESTSGLWQGNFPLRFYSAVTRDLIRLQVHKVFTSLEPHHRWTRELTCKYHFVCSLTLW